MIEIEAETPNQSDARELFSASDALMESLFPPEQNHLVYEDALTKPGSVFLMARQDGKPVGCGAYVPFAAEQAEIKRMFVHEHARGKGVARRILSELEKRARAAGIARMFLETGSLLDAARALYLDAGYVETGPFADYPNSEMSLFFEKRLG